MIPISFTLGPLAAANPALYAASQTPVSGTALTLTGTTTPIPRQVLLTFGSEASPRTMAITGADLAGNILKETLSIPATSAGTVGTMQSFVSVTQALPAGGGWSNAVTLGTSGIASSPWKISNSPQFGPVEYAFQVIVTGTINWTIEVTLDNPNDNSNVMGSQALGNPAVPPTPFPTGVATLTAQTASGLAWFTDPIRAWRATLNSGTGSIAVRAIEAGITTSGG
jgi:hypothetical protein